MDSKNLDKNEKTDNEKKEGKAGKAMLDKWYFKYNLVFQMLYLWVFPIVYRGYKKAVTMMDLPPLSNDFKSEVHVKRFRFYWSKFEKFGKLRLISTIFMCVIFEFTVGGLFRAFSIVFSSLYPFFLSLMLNDLKPLLTDEGRAEIKDIARILPATLQPSWDANGMGYRSNSYLIWVWLLLLTVFRIGSVLFEEYSTYVSSCAALKIRAFLSTVIFEKGLTMSVAARKRHHAGKVVNMLGNDMTLLETSLQLFHTTWSAIITLIVSFSLLGIIMGISVLACVAYAVFVVICVVVISLLVFKTRKKIMGIRDSQTECINEVFSGIRIIKLFAWEVPYLDRIFKLRAKSMKQLRVLYFLILLTTLVIANSPTIMQFVGLLVYFFVNDRSLDVVMVLSSHAYFQIIRFPLTTAPRTIMQLLTALLSLMRVQNYLEEGDIERQALGKDGDGDDEEEEEESESEYAVNIENGRFEWIRDDVDDNEAAGDRKGGKKFDKLLDINFKVKRGEFVVVVGSVGSGKSNLLQALIHEMPRVGGGEAGGEMRVNGSVAYCAQEAWIMNETLLNNVTFGDDVDETLWEEVVDVCALKTDLEILQGGRNIEIGEQGINLSGGQKYRVSLARACYSQRDIYLMDDPMAAVDSHVGTHIFKKCICEFLREKTRIVATHQLQYCANAECDKIVLMKEGRICEMGTFEQLMDKGGEFSKLYRMNIRKQKEKTPVVASETANVPLTSTPAPSLNKPGYDAADIKTENRIIEKEERTKGTIRWGTLKSYIQYAGGFPIFGIILLIFFCSTLFNNVLCDWWITNVASKTYFLEIEGNTFNTTYCNISSPENSGYETFYFLSEECNATNSTSLHNEQVEIFWDPNYTNNETVRSGLSGLQAILIYFALVCCVPIWYSFRGGSIFTALLTAANRMFKTSIERVISSPMRFFEANPLGRILSRFTVDSMLIDADLPLQTLIAFGVTIAVVIQFILICYTTNGVFVPFVLIVGVLYLLFFSFFRKTSRELKRVESNQRSPIIAQMSETLTGVATIRSYQRESNFIAKNRKTIDEFNRVHHVVVSATRWMTIYMSFTGFLLTLLTMVISIPFYFYFDVWGIFNSSVVALGITKAVTVNNIFYLSAFYVIEMEVRLNAVERIDHYCRIPIEEPLLVNKEGGAKKKKKKTLDVKLGKVQFRNVSMRYRPNLPRVLKSMDFSIAPGEMIGIVGRTGSGKSSLLVALMRIVNHCEGQILIDDQDISQVSLQSLRGSIGIIPQDPILFSGSIRSNLDPFGEYTDNQVMEALRKAHLSSVVNQVQGGIHGKMDENGKNFSVGERQLICLARAILKDSRILLLDECTASVDMDTDRLIQKTIREEFDATVLTIAHRLVTICDYHRIMVLDDGKVAEFDTPQNLISRGDDSMFLQMIQDTPNSSFIMRKIQSGGLGSPVQIYRGMYEGEMYKIALHEKHLQVGGDLRIMLREIEKVTRKKKVFKLVLGDGKVYSIVLDSSTFENDLMRKLNVN